MEENYASLLCDLGKRERGCVFVMELPRSEYPRPDFMREHWQCLNGEWDFAFDREDMGLESGPEGLDFNMKITVPFCYQSQMSGIGITEDVPAVWYRRNFTVDQALVKAGALLLKFGAVDYQADVWVNGIYMGSHEGGHSSFEINISRAVCNGENQLVVRAADDCRADKPRGKQTWTGRHFGCWYTPTTGIWQPVWLEYTGKTYIQRIKITPCIDTLTALVEVFLSSEKPVPVQIQANTTVDGEPWDFGTLSLLCRNGYAKAVLPFKDFDICCDKIYWSPEHPNLIDVIVSAKGEGGKDVVRTYFGMRSTGSHNGILTLNNDVYYQRLILDQGYWKESLLTAPSDAAIIKDIELTKAMGFNGARKHQKIEDPRYYYWADKLGLLVWGELPSSYEFNDMAIRRSARELSEFVERDFNHPCIVTWVPLNESWGVRNILADEQQTAYCKMLYYMLKALDPTRLVSANDGWEQISETDICAIHDYSIFPETIGKYDNMAHILETAAEKRILFANGSSYRGQPVMMTEYGGIAFEEDGSNAEDSWGYYGKVRDEIDFIKRLEPVTDYLIKSGRFAGFCYTQLTDVFQEVNGLLTMARNPKVDVDTLRRVFGKNQ